MGIPQGVHPMGIPQGVRGVPKVGYPRVRVYLRWDTLGCGMCIRVYPRVWYVHHGGYTLG